MGIWRGLSNTNTVLADKVSLSSKAGCEGAFSKMLADYPRGHRARNLGNPEWLTALAYSGAGHRGASSFLHTPLSSPAVVTMRSKTDNGLG